MADITRIEVTTKTGDAPFAGTDGGVYLALGGREFCLDIENHDDFERNQGDQFLLGMPYRPGHEHPGFRPVINAKKNDPRHPHLNSRDLDAFPAWIRLDAAGDFGEWLLESVRVQITVNSDDEPEPDLEYRATFDEPGLWLSRDFGLYCFLPKVLRPKFLREDL